ncbi:hypothetical protein ACJX0J_025152, partial [Zea mays]
MSLVAVLVEIDTKSTFSVALIVFSTNCLLESFIYHTKNDYIILNLNKKLVNDHHFVVRT